MPLKSGKKNIGYNIKMLLDENKPLAQAQAIALNVARRGGAKIKRPPPKK